jgi:hypothetical protein
MDEFTNFFNCKLYTKEDLLNWDLPEKIQDKLGLHEHDFFFLANSKENSHEGHKHIHLSIYPTKFDVINILEVEIPNINPNVLEKILKIVIKNKFDVITSTGTCKAKNKCYLGIFFSKPIEAATEELISEIGKIKEVKRVKISIYNCNGYCEE